MKKLKVENIYNYKILGAINFIKDDSFLFVKKVLNEEKNTYESNIWLHNLNEKSFKKLTAGVNDSNPVFNSEKNEVIFLSKRDKDKKEIGLYKISMEFGEAELIREYSNPPENIQWKKKNVIFYTKNERYDGKKIEKEDDDKKIYHFKHIPFLVNGQGMREDVGNHLFKFNLKTKKEECLIKGFVDVNNFDLTDDGRRLVVCLNKNPEDPVKASAFLYDLKEDKKEEINIKGYTVSKVLWSDSKSIFILASDESRGFATSPTLFIYDTDTKMLKMLIDPKKNEFSTGNSLNSDVLGVAGRNFKVRDKRLYFIATEGIKTSIYSISSKAEIKKEVDFGSSITDFDINSANNVAFIRSSSITPSEIYYYDYSDFYKVSEYNNWFYKKVNSEVKFIKFNSSDGKEIDGLILFPPEFEEKNKKYPAILEIHGGPRTAYGNSYMHEFQSLAAKGYVVIACNPRGSSGYGSDFADILKHYGERDFKDIMEFVEFCTANYKFIDKDRIGVTGGSYGGFMTNWIVGHTTFFKAAVSQRSISNWFSMYGSTDIGYYFCEDQIGEDYLTEPYKFIKQSPIFYSKNVKTPILFIHSLNDFRCEVQQAMQFFTTLKRLGKKTEMILFPGETHELSRSGKPVHRVKRLNAMIDWFNKYLK